MATRYQTYEMSYGWCTIDTKTEAAPSDYISGPYDVTLAEVDEIKQGASIKLDKASGEPVVKADKK